MKLSDLLNIEKKPKSKEKKKSYIDVSCKKQYEEYEKLQREIVHAYHEQSISLNKSLKNIVPGSKRVIFSFPKGSKGGILSMECLKKLDDKFSNEIKKNITEKGCVLCHIEGWIFTLPEDYIKHIRG